MGLQRTRPRLGHAGEEQSSLASPATDSPRRRETVSLSSVSRDRASPSPAMPSDAGVTGLHPGPAMWWPMGSALPAADSDSNGEVGLN